MAAWTVSSQPKQSSLARSEETSTPLSFWSLECPAWLLTPSPWPSETNFRPNPKSSSLRPSANARSGKSKITPKEKNWKCKNSISRRAWPRATRGLWAKRSPRTKRPGSTLWWWRNSVWCPVMKARSKTLWSRSCRSCCSELCPSYRKLCLWPPDSTANCSWLRAFWRGCSCSCWGSRRLCSLMRAGGRLGWKHWYSEQRLLRSHKG